MPSWRRILYSASVSLLCHSASVRFQRELVRRRQKIIVKHRVRHGFSAGAEESGPESCAAQSETDCSYNAASGDHVNISGRIGVRGEAIVVMSKTRPSHNHVTASTTKRS